MSQFVEGGANAQRDELYALAGDEDEGIENFAEEAYVLESISVLFGQLAAVALYAVVEIRTKSALSWQATRVEIREVYRFAALKALFAR